MRSLKYILCIGFLATGCGGDDDKDRVKVAVINPPEVEPKISSATPSALTSASLVLQEEITNPGESLKSRMFSDGPTDIIDILDAVDAAVASLEKRIANEDESAEALADEEEKTVSTYAPCLGSFEGETFTEADAVAYELSFDFDDDGVEDLDPDFTTYLNCYDDLTQPDGSTPTADSANPDSGYWRAFGKEGTGDSQFWYIVEGSDPDSATSAAGASAVKVANSTDEVEIWFRVGKNTDGSAVLAHMKRRTDGFIEYTHSGKGVGYGCGNHILISKSDDLAYFIVKTDQEVNGEDGVECADFTGSTDVEYCIDLSEDSFASVSTSTCSDAGLESSAFELDSLDYTVVTFTEAINTFDDTPPDGTTIFYIENTPEED